MHGCPPEEIERIACHLLNDRELDIVVKLNPTLLGEARVREILHGDLGFTHLEIPDDVFAHDLRFDAALDLIASLRTAAAACGRTFAVKLSNTLAMRNPSTALPGDTVYMSGRALYPITVALFQTLRHAVGNDLPITYSAGADALNAPALLAAGACPITFATELLKPGGYARLRHVLDEIDRHMDAAGAPTLDAFASDAARALDREAKGAVGDPRYRADYAAPELAKLESPLTRFDCITAPCVATCPTCQDVPVYAACLANGDADAALAAVLHRNLLPTITGQICTARCESRCTRAHLDRPVRIRDLKRFAAEHGRVSLSRAPAVGRRVAVLGAGPSGLAAAGALALSGVRVTVFERRDHAGGMPAIAPAFRIPSSAVDLDVSRIAALGVAFRFGIEMSPDAALAEGFDAVYAAPGLPLDATLDGVPGLDARGVFGALDVLRRVCAGQPPELGECVLVVGGGNTAIDVARTALRLGASTTILYRRTRAELPADRDEVADFLDEGGRLDELVSPVAAIASSGQLVAVECLRNRLGEPDADGRRRPIPVAESRFRVPATSLVLAIGQRAASPEFTQRLVVDPRTGRTGSAGIYAGGDVARGASTIIEAVADGRRAAQTICDDLGVPFREPELPAPRDPEALAAQARRARGRKVLPRLPHRLPAAERAGFELVTQTLDGESARAEAARCLQCQLFCDRCIDVCPNRANVGLFVPPLEVEAPIVDLETGDAAGSERFALRQSRQIIHVVDLCNECGNCATFCVHQGRPFADKPRLTLSRAAFDAADSAMLLSSGGLEGKDADGAMWRVEPHDGGVRVEDPVLCVDLDRASCVTSFVLRRRGSGRLSTARAIERAVLWRSLLDSPLRLFLDRAKGEP